MKISTKTKKNKENPKNDGFSDFTLELFFSVRTVDPFMFLKKWGGGAIYPML